MTTLAHSRAGASHAIALRGGAAAVHHVGIGPALVDGALERIALARTRLQAGDLPEHGQLLQAARDLLGELQGSLDLRAGNAYAANLDDLCDYLSRQLAAAGVHNRVATLDEVSHLLREIRSAWSMYV